MTVNLRINPVSAKTKLMTFMILFFLMSINVSAVFAAEINLAKNHQGTPGTIYKCGDVVQIQISISSDVPLYDLRIEDQLDPDETYDSLVNTQTSNPASVSFVYNPIPNNLIWDFGPGPFASAPQAIIDYSITISQVVTDPDQLTNTAVAYYKLTPGGPESSTSIPEVLNVGCPTIDIDKTGPSSLYNGSSITWTITLTNIGSFDAENVEIIDMIPTGVVGPITAQETSLPNQGVITILTSPDMVVWNGTVPVGAPVTIQISGTVNTQNDYIDNTGIINRTRPDVQTVKTEDTWRTQILPIPVGGDIYGNPLNTMRYVIIGLMGILVLVVKKISN